jgi:hypothetical protein
MIRSSRVTGDFGGYRRLFAYLAAFGREGVDRQCGGKGKGGCIGLQRFVDIGRRFDMNRDIKLML